MSTPRSVRPGRSRLAAPLTALALGALLAAPAPARADFDLDIWYDRDPLERPAPGDRRGRAGPRQRPGSSVPSSARLMLNGVNVTSQLAPSGEYLEGVVEGFNDGWNLLGAEGEREPALGAGVAAREEPSDRRADLLGSAAAALRLHHGPRRARAADHRQPGDDRDPGRAGRRERQLSARLARLSDGRRHDHRLEQELRGQPARRVPVPHDRRQRSCRCRARRPAAGRTSR